MSIATLAIPRVRINLYARPGLQATVEDAETGAILARFNYRKTSLARVLETARAWVATAGFELVATDIDD